MQQNKDRAYVMCTHFSRYYASECEYVSFINSSLFFFYFFLLHSKSVVSRIAKMWPVPTHAYKYMICNVLQRVDACAKQHEVIKTATLLVSRDKLISPHLL